MRAAKVFWNLPTPKPTQIDCILFYRSAKDFGIANKHCILSNRAEKIFGIANKTHGILFSRAAKNLEFTKEATQINWVCSAAQRKILEFANKTNSKTAFRSASFQGRSMKM
jgi:hypothetical protein